MKLLLFSVIVIMLCACAGPTGSTGNELKIATAANMQMVMDSIAVVFEKETGTKVEISSNSSGMLTAQIEKGAPYDVFVSANMRYPEKLYRTKNGNKPVKYARGKLVVAFPKKFKVSSLEELLALPEVKRVAIANIETAPYGMAANEYLLSSGLKSKYAEKFIFGESVGQVNQYLASKSVDAIFTSNSFLKMEGQRYSYFIVDESTYTAIDQGIMLLSYGKKHHEEESQEFINFVQSEKCKSILEHFGYYVD